MSIEKVARNILRTVRNNFGGFHEFRSVFESKFPHIDINFYNKMQDRLELLGFTKVCDIEDLTIKKNKPDPRSFIRVMSNSRTGASSGIYHIKPKFPWPLILYFGKLGPSKVFEFETEFTDGHLICTSIASKLSEMPHPDSQVKIYLHKSTSVEKVLDVHNEAVDKYLKENVGTATINQKTMEDVIKSQNRQFRIVDEHLESIGWVTKEYLLKSAGNNKFLANKIYDMIQEIIAKEKN